MRNFTWFAVSAALVSLGLFLQSYSIQAQTTLFLRPGATTGNDARIHSLDAGNRGRDIELPVMAWTWNTQPGFDRSLIEFDLSGVPDGAHIELAVLSLFSMDQLPNGRHSELGGTNEWSILRITDPWDEKTVTWENKPACASTHQVLVPATSNPEQNFAVDVRQLVQDMIADREHSHGFMLKIANEVFNSCQWPIGRRMVNFASSNYPEESGRPSLIIVYTAATPVDNIATTASDWMVYPNPAAERVSLRFPSSTSTADVSVFNACGMLVAREPSFSRGSSLGVSGYARGVYRIVVHSNGVTRTMSFVKY